MIKCKLEIEKVRLFILEIRHYLFKSANLISELASFGKKNVAKLTVL